MTETTEVQSTESGRPAAREEDLTREEPSPVTPLPIVEVGGRYDPSPAREQMRGVIAMLLLAGLGLIIAGAFATLWFQLAPIESLQRLLELIFTPMIGLVGAVTGFYYGSATQMGDRR